MAATELKDREAPGLTEALLGLLRHPDRAIRYHAARALEHRAGPGVTEALLRLIEDSDPGVRQEAVQGLAGREALGVTEALLGLPSRGRTESRQGWRCEALQGGRLQG